LQHSTYSSQSLELNSFSFLYCFYSSSTYTILANSKSPNIKCLGRVSTTLDIRRVRVAFGRPSLLAPEMEGRRPPKQSY
jgi:hypothetical protein